MYRSSLASVLRLPNSYYRTILSKMILTGTRHLTKKFYDVFIKSRCKRQKRTLILCAADVDAVCALKILLHLFTCDLIDYTLEICTNRSDIEEAMNTHRDSTHHVVLINCGAMENLKDLLKLDYEVVVEPPEGPGPRTVFVVDNHRPIHVENLFSSDQIKVLAHNVDVDKFPVFEDVYRKDDGGDNGEPTIDDQGSQSAQQNKRKKTRKEREEFEAWMANREKVLKDYYKNISYERSSALKMFDLAHAVSKDDSDLFFWGVIGLCDMYMQRKILKSDFVTVSQYFFYRFL